MIARLLPGPVFLGSLILLFLGISAPASADFGIRAGSYSAGMSSLKAGAHPDVSVAFAFNIQAVDDPFFGHFPDDNVRTIIVDLPPGLVGNAQAYPQCTTSTLATEPACPADTQVGVITYTLAPELLFGNETAPVYNMVPQSGRPAEFAFKHTDFGQAQIHLLPSVRSNDYGITTTVPHVASNLKPLEAAVTFWGVPADPSHDPERGSSKAGGCLTLEGPSGESCPYPSQMPPKAFLRSPTRCGTVAVKLSVDSWQNPDQYLSYTSEPQTLEGCDVLQQQFKPSLRVTPTSDLAGAATGLDVKLRLPQTDPADLVTPSTPDLRTAVVTLPEGMSINPSQADGLGACSPAQIGLKTASEPRCPDASKIGSVEVETPLLPSPLEGSVYLASPSENPFGSLLAIYIVAEGHGVRVKLPGKIEASPETGQLTTTFDQNPQLPFEDLRLHLFGGQRAALINPPSCGTHIARAALTSWAAPEPVDRQASFQLASGADGKPCGARPFAPGFEAGTVSPIAGAHSPFVLKLTREDGSQEFRSLSATLPPGLIGKLAGISYCPEAALSPAAALQRSGLLEAETPICPAASMLGKVVVGAGAGAPFHVKGTAYLAGPYKGAPLSLAIVTPAVAGPFDLGTVVVRTALQVDPKTAQITATSDEIPHILQGIPLAIRSIAVELDRPGFTLNPTSCDEMSVVGTATSLQGATAALSNPFQVADCAALPFKPRLSISLAGKTKRSGNPALRAVLRARPGEANIARTSVALPGSEFLAESHIDTICTRVQFAADQCPKGSVYGHARAFTPLLDKPLEGPVYLRSSNHTLPDLVADLKGQIEIELSGRIDTDSKGGIRTTFAKVPDAPVSKFVLTMPGGRKSLLDNHVNLCRRPHRATVKMDAHNGKIHDFKPLVRVGCGGKQGR
jgi:hypothetical protein